MIEIKVSKKFVWPVRILFLVLALFITNIIVDKYQQGYIISSGTTKYEYGSTAYFTHMFKYVAFNFVLILFAVRTVEKNPAQMKMLKGVKFYEIQIQTTINPNANSALQRVFLNDLNLPG